MQENGLWPLALTDEWDTLLLTQASKGFPDVVRQCEATDWLGQLPDECVDLVYIDPPFGSGRKWSMRWKDGRETSFDDRVSRGIEAYAAWLTTPLEEIHRVLKPTGSAFMHLDWHGVHYLKVALDRVFGYHNFQNEIIWAYRTAGNNKRHFARKHDNILFYAKDHKRAKFFPQRQRSYLKKRYGYGEHYRELYDEAAGKYYTEVLMRDVWDDISPLKSCNRERVGYPTQKPLALLRRIIAATTEPGDVVADFFCGSGTSLLAAEELGRRYFGCDISEDAVQVTVKRLQEAIRQRREQG